ncbi:MAG: hypothetical protein KAR31_02195, partial [Candidatus Omnitrophica bacterium]|nr:hypothetical protein [Candidatus Omnitrophota bacterium]
MNILGIVAHTLGYGDSSAVLSVDGKIVGIIEEERFSRKRYDDTFPQRAVSQLLKMGKISGSDIDVVSLHLHPFRGIVNRAYWAIRHPWHTFANYGKYIQYYRKYGNLHQELCQVLGSNHFKIEHYCHHECHAAAAFYSSPFEESAFLTLDGSGEGVTGAMGVVTKDQGVKILHKNAYPHSLGLAYSAICDHLGFSPPSGPGKIMGLAPYGDSERFLPLLRKMIQCKDAHIKLSLDYFVFHENLATPLTNKPWVSEKLALEVGIKKRDKTTPLEQIHMDLAAALQARTNEVGIALAKYAAKITGKKNLCLGGGVTLNSV